MITNLARRVAVCVFFAITTMFAVVLPPVIATNASFDAGILTANSTVLIASSATVWFAAGSTVEFVQASGELVVDGSLHAAGTTFAGILGGPWGRIAVRPGATCTLVNCVLSRGGGTALPPPPLSNAMFFAQGAAVAISNCTALLPHGDCFAFQGGTIDFAGNITTATTPGYGVYAGVALYGGAAQPTIWRSSGNSMLGLARPGIWVEGTFAQDLDLATGPGERLHLAAIMMTNAIMSVAAGATVAMNDIVPGSVTIAAGGALRCQGTPAAPILWTNYFGLNPWPGITWLPGSTGVVTSTTFTRALSHSLSNAVVVLTDVRFIHLQDGLSLTDYSRLEGNNVLFHGMVNRGVSVRSHSSLLLRQCQFIDNNAPYINSVESDNTAGVDVRFCWWDAADGPYPFGAYGNQHVLTNATSVFFPWLLAAPGSQTNPPIVRITSHAEPFSTPAAQVVISGIATDNTSVARLQMRNGRCPITFQPSFNPPNWQAQVWLYAGINPIAVYAYDDEGNASVDAVMINCTGAGVGTGGAVPPTFDPLGTRHALVGIPLAIGVVASSPSEPAIMTYWAANLPVGASFDPLLRQFEWPSPTEGVFSNVAFFVTDGGSVATALCTIVVTTLPTPAIRAISTPDMYAFQPYFYMAAPDGVPDPLDWRFSFLALPEGVAASRAGIVCGVPLNLDLSIPLPFTVRALNAAGVASATVAGSINRYVTDTGANLRMLAYDLPTVLASTPLAYQFTSTNGLPPVTWQDINGDCVRLGAILDRSGGLTGAIAIAGMHPATILMHDATNRTCAANIVLPIVAAVQQLRFVPKKNAVSIFISQNPSKTRKSSITLKAMFEAPTGFTLTSNDLAACRVGFVLCDAGLPFKAKLNKKNLFIQNLSSRYTKIQVNRMGNGMLKFSCTIKNADLRLHLAQYGIVNETNPALSATVPVWIQIGARMTVLRQVPVAGKAKLNVFSKAKAKW